MLVKIFEAFRLKTCLQILHRESITAVGQYHEWLIKLWLC